MPIEEPVAAIVREDHVRWKIELRSLKACQDALGADVLNTFCRCFIHAGRLATLLDLQYLSRMQYKPSSRDFERHQETITWSALCTARELTRELRNLREALSKRGVLDIEKEPWKALRSFEIQISTDPLFARVNVAVKVNLDQDTLGRGIAAVESVVLLAEGDGGRLECSSLRLGLAVLFKAYGMNLSDIERFMHTLGDGHDVSNLLQQAFILALGVTGISLVEQADASVA